MTNFSHGQSAEEAATEYLVSHGFKILAKNWRTKYCEIDIVAARKKKAYFVEVKYRRSDAQGSGLDYITPKKLRQMAFAAEMWVGNQGWQGDYALAAIEVSGSNYEIGAFLTDIDT